MIEISLHRGSKVLFESARFFVLWSAEALPIVREVREVCEREKREIQREKDGSDVTTVALKLAMSLHFPLPKIRTFRFSLHTCR